MGLQYEVGQAIRLYRERAGLSQSAVAEATRRSSQMIGMIERGERAPSFETLEAIGAVLGIAVRDFFPGPARLPDEFTARIFGLLAPLNARERRRVYRIMVSILGDD